MGQRWQHFPTRVFINSSFPRLTHRVSDNQDISDSFYLLHMDLSPEKKITMDGHDLLLMEKPAEGQHYCCHGCKEKDARPCYKHENEGDSSYYLHAECYDSTRTKSYTQNLIGSNKNCEYGFHEEDLGGEGVCGGCGDDVMGWFFKCKLCKNPHYLHPCCAKLPIKKHVESGEGEITVYLQANTTLPSKCQVCGRKETSGGLGVRNYISHISTGRKYCYHWSCVKHMELEKWNKDDDDDKNGSNKRSPETSLMSSQASKRMNTETVATQLPEKGRQKEEYDAAGKGIAGLPALPTRAKKRPGTLKPILGFTAEVAVELLNILFVVFGLPPLPLGLLLKFFK